MKVCIEPILTVAVTVVESLSKNTGNVNVPEINAPLVIVVGILR